jgi:DNA-binding response OmpR family regulator
MAKILVVDDEISMRLLYARELADDGHAVVTASSSHEALEQFRSEHPDLVILDIRLPGMDGLEVLGRMLSIDRKTPIILLSGYSFYRENFLSWAADAYLTKSSDTSELRRLVKRLLKSSLVAAPGSLPGDPSAIREYV